MIYLFYGEDKYRLLERLKEILRLHEGTGGNLNTSTIEDKYDFPTIKNEAESLPFLSDKRLLIIKNLLKSKDKAMLEKVAKWLPIVPTSTDIVFVEDESPDQRLAMYKSLAKNGKIEIFNELKPNEVITWVKKLATEHIFQIDPEAVSLLQLYCGSDLTRIKNELDKLASYDSHITKVTVELLVEADFFNTIFELTDAISERKTKKALDILARSMDTGENEIYLVTMLARQIRNLLIVKDLSDHRLSESEIVGKTRMHPFVVKKSLMQSRNFTKNQLLALHGNLIELDLAMKTASTDPRLLLQKFVAEMTI